MLRASHTSFASSLATLEDAPREIWLDLDESLFNFSPPENSEQEGGEPEVNDDTSSTNDQCDAHDEELLNGIVHFGSHIRLSINPANLTTFDTFLGEHVQNESLCPDYYPFPTKIFAMLYFLQNGPRPMGESVISFVQYILKQCGCAVPSLKQLKAFKLPGLLSPRSCLTPNGTLFYMISLVDIVSQCLGSPDTSSLLRRFPIHTDGCYTELYHGKCWKTDPRFRAPMVCLPNGTPVFTRDVVLFYHPHLGFTKGLVTEFFKKEGCFDVFVHIDVMLEAIQFNSVVEGADVTLPNDALILYEDLVVPLSVVYELALPPKCIAQWDGEHKHFKGFDDQEMLLYFMQNPCGNKCKKWHKFESWYLLFAGLPRQANGRHVNIHFVCCSDSVSPLDMARPISEDLARLENEGVEMYDAQSQEKVLVVAPLMLIICDNPRASELANHLGSAANKFCRICEVDKGVNPYMIDEERTLEKCLVQIEAIHSQPTVQSAKEMQTLYGLRATANPMLEIRVNVYRRIPIEVLHTLLLGPYKYLLKEFVPKLTERMKEEVLARVNAFPHSGLIAKMYGNVCRYFKSFVGRDFKGWAQMAVFVLSPYLSTNERKVLLSLSKVFQIAYCNFFSVDLALQWQQICEEFVTNVKDYMPNLLRKPKIHLLLHLVQSMQDFGPCSAFSAERCESFNATVRAQNIYSNRLSPSRDICHHFAVQQHLRYLCDAPSSGDVRCGDALKRMYLSPMMQHFFNNVPIEELNAGRSIHHPGALRKLRSKHPQMLKHVNLGIVGLSYPTACIEGLQNDQGVNIQLLHCLPEDYVKVFAGIIARDSELVNAGDFVETVSNQYRYSLFLAACQLHSGQCFCLLQGCEDYILNGQPVLNDYKCPLVSLTKNIFTVDCNQVKRAVSLVHDCTDTCTFEERDSSRRIERKLTNEKALHFKHDWCNMMYCLNVYFV